MAWARTVNNRKPAPPAVSAREQGILEGMRIAAKTQETGWDGWQTVEPKRKSWVNKARASQAKRKEEAEGFLCRWAGCCGAEAGIRTWGGKSHCFSCQRPKGTALAPPLEAMTEAAFEAKIKEATAGDKKAPQPAAPAKPPSAKPQLRDAENQKLRTQRLQLLKKAQGGEEQPLLKEVAAAFNADPSDERKKLEIDAELVQGTQKIAELAKNVLESLKSETLPTQRALRLPDEILEDILAKSTPFAAQGEREEAEKRLTATRAALTVLTDIGTPSDDAAVTALQSKLTRQEAALKKLENSAATAGRKKSALTAAKGAFVDRTKAQTDYAASCATKAADRAEQRGKMVDQIRNIVEELDVLNTLKTQELKTAHGQRAAKKRDAANAVIESIDEKLSELEHEDTFADAVSDAEEDLTNTEVERNEALAAAASLRAQILKLEAAANAAEREAQAANTPQPASPAPRNEEPWDDLWINFPAEMSQVPGLVGEPTPDQQEALEKLSALFKAVPWGCTLPSLRFLHTGVHPCFFHGIAGDTLWSACWGDRAPTITPQHAIPYQLLNVVKYAIENRAVQQTEEQLQAGKERYKAVVGAAEARRRAGDPY